MYGKNLGSLFPLRNNRHPIIKNFFVNINGGLKADGNPLGATGGAEIFEVFKQLRQEAGERQIKPENDLRVGCVQELEGFGTKAYVYILGRD